MATIKHVIYFTLMLLSSVTCKSADQKFVPSNNIDPANTNPADKADLVMNLIKNDADYPDRPIDDNIETTIINGSLASIGEFPYMVLTFRNAGMKWQVGCGASLIGPHHVLTAAHCFLRYVRRPSDVSVRVNELKIRSNLTKSRDYNVSKIIIHPEYNNSFEYRYTHDVCVMILGERVAYSSYVQPILLAQPQHGNFEGNQVTLSGWGQTERSRQSAELRKLNTTVVSERYCNDMYYKEGYQNVSAVHICTYVKQRASCYGDSGSPLVAQNESSRVQVGIVSWAIPGCYAPGYPTVYTRVSFVYHWITKQIQDNP